MRFLIGVLLVVPPALAHPAYDIAADGEGNVYFLDWPAKRLLRVSQKGVLATVADLSKVAPRTDPHTLALDKDGNVLVGASYEGRVWRISPKGRIDAVDLTAWALRGGNVLNLSYAGGRPWLLVAHERNRRFRLLADRTKELLDIRQGQAGYLNLYAGSFCVADNGTVYLSADHRIWKLVPGVGPVVFAGGKEPGLRDGKGPHARFQSPYGLCVGHKGGLLVADQDNGRIRAVDAKGNVTTLPGKFERPHAICTGPRGVVCVAEYGRGEIRIRVIEKDRVRTLAAVKTR